MKVRPFVVKIVDALYETPLWNMDAGDLVAGTLIIGSTFVDPGF